MDKDMLSRWRKAHGLTRKELAGFLGITAMAIAYWEWGKRSIPSLLPLALEALEHKMKARGGKDGTIS
jgi:transcriptional regulator with XRE-family HTH domain